MTTAELSAGRPASGDRALPALDWVPARIPMRDAWIPVGHAADFGKRPTSRILHSARCFIWREGKQLVASAFHPAAIHRETTWASDMTSQTGRIPVVEQSGLVWIWYGDPANARLTLIPALPHLPADGALPRYMRGQTRMHCSSELTMENLMDLTHADFLHSDILGDPIADDDVITVESTSETITMTRTCINKAVAPIMQKAAGITAKTQNVRFITHIYIRSHVAAMYSRFEPGVDVRMVHCSTPETRDSNTVNFIQDTSGARRPYRYLFPLASYKITAQDDYALKPQAPRYHHQLRRRDLHSRFDAASIRYRQLVEEILQRQERGDYSYESDELISGDKRGVLGMNRPVIG